MERRKLRQRDTQNVKHCDQSVSQRQAHASNCFIAPWAHHDSVLATYHPTALPKQANEFHVFHQLHFRKAAHVDKHSSPAEYPVVATSHSQQDPGVMRKTVRQSINPASRQANSKVTASDLWINHDALHLIQTLPGHFGINMQKPKDVALRGTSANVHLCCSTAFAHDNLIAKAPSEISRAIGASTICYNNLASRRSLAQLVKKWPYQRRFVKDGNNN
jgi:hypothetical protein